MFKAFAVHLFLTVIYESQSFVFYLLNFRLFLNIVVLTSTLTPKGGFTERNTRLRATAEKYWKS